MMHRIKALRAGNKVKRFHTLNTIVGETVGHHSANVALLCVFLFDGKVRAELLIAALTHDYAEQFTGDIPATAKWSSAALTRALNDLEDRYSILPQELTAQECRVLKAADMLDLCWKAFEEYEMGNTPILPVWRNGVKYLRDNYGYWPDLMAIIEEMENDLSK